MKTIRPLFLPGLLLLLLSTHSSAQDALPARFLWEGVVDGKTILRVRQRKVDYEFPSGLPLQRQRYNFSEPLPLVKVEVQLNVIEGRGEVKLLEQPGALNNYTAVIEINDRQRGSAGYVMELLWERPRNSGGINEPIPGGETFTWRGRVDGEAIVRIRSSEAVAETISGAAVNRQQFRYSSPLPSQKTQVSLVIPEGRGEIALLEQPSAKNNYTAAVRIRDAQRGESDYRFTLTWERPFYSDRETDHLPKGSVGLVWSARVDGSDKLRIRAEELQTEHLTGVPMVGMEYRFVKPLPLERRTITIRKIKGRGSVMIVEHPSASNGFTAVILIEDKSGGSSVYEIEVSW
jgi:hypothetical protein